MIDLLVTRPFPAARQTVLALKRRGYQSHETPLLKIVHFPPEPILAEDVSGFIITSPNGLLGLSKQQEWEKFKTFPIWTVGTKTAEKARLLGAEKIYIAQNNVASLIDLLKSSKEAHLGKIAYIRGRDIHQPLQEPLAKIGIHAQEHICYAAHLLTQFSTQTQNLLKTESLQGVLIYSRRTGYGFREAFQKANLPLSLKESLNIFCLSEQIAQDFKTEGWLNCHSPSVSTEENLFELIDLVLQ